MNKILIFLISIFFYISQTYAGVVPGTIQKGTSSTSVSCSTSTSSYVTSNGCNSAGSCNYGPSAAICGTTSYCTGYNASGSCIGTGYSANSCYRSSGGQSYTSSSTSYNNYHNNSVSLPYNGSIKLTNDTQTCNPRTTGVSSGANYGGYRSCTAGSCGSGGAGSWYTPYHGYCSSATSVKTIISSYDQLGNRTYSFNNSETTQYNSTRNVNLTATCQIEGRYATADNNKPPLASLNGVSNVFAGNDNQWCNILKYRQVGYTYKADENPGCEYYRKLNTTGNPTGNEDLLKGLSINIKGDISGIGEVQIQLGKCYAKYEAFSKDLSQILVNPNSSSTTTVKDTYKNNFTILYDNTVYALGKNQPSLKTAFGGKIRLDECLSEGKNSISVLVKDMARCESDGVALCPNVSDKFTKGTINIDNSTPKLQLSGNLTTTSLSGTLAGGFEGTITNDGTVWRNYTLSGTIKGGEKYEGGIENECKSFSGTLTGQCSGSLVGGQIWTSPSGVNPTSGKFMQYKCDNLGPFPTTAECKMGCPVGQEWNPNKNKCEQNLCKSFVGGAEVVIENGVNGVVTGNTCMGYCIPGHSVGCVVKEIKVACSGTFEVEGDWELNCGDNSTANQWYKEKGRCGQTEGINYRNGIISEHGTQLAKEFFNENYLKDCQWITGTTDIKKCNDIYICGYGEYNIATKKCIRNECGTGLVNGICGSGNGTTLTRYPSFSQACSSGVPIVVDIYALDGSYNWICDGKDGGTRAYCSANIKQESNMCILDAKLDCTLY